MPPILDGVAEAATRAAATGGRPVRIRHDRPPSPPGTPLPGSISAAAGGPPRRGRRTGAACPERRRAGVPFRRRAAAGVSPGGDAPGQANLAAPREKTEVSPR